MALRFTFSPEEIEKLKFLRIGDAYLLYLRDTSVKVTEPDSGQEGFTFLS